ncbi:MAG: hypothetical protein IH621_11960 [Krumholzibacteria bacterium]|nr:hypothetical protein [Candidatus Krumholzibacteria bacterium]
MKTRVNVFVAAAVLVCLVPAAAFALTQYAEDFDGLGAGDTGALGAAGWLVFGNVFGPDMSYWYGYGVFPAPNDGAAFCSIGVDGANQFLNVFNDYNNANHGDGTNAIIESNVFQEQTVVAGDVGQTWVFGFDAMMNNVEGASTAKAFIKTLNPAAGYATTNFITADMTNIPASWGSYTLQIVVDASLVGQILQIGFVSTASNYEGSGVFYDNVTFSIDGVIPAEDASWGEVKALFR